MERNPELNFYVSLIAAQNANQITTLGLAHSDAVVGYLSIIFFDLSVDFLS